MECHENSEYRMEEILQVIESGIDAIYIVDMKNSTYKMVKASQSLYSVFGNAGSYDDMLKTLVFHFSDKADEVDAKYQVFLSNLNRFDGKYSKRIKIFVEEKPIIAQMTIYPYVDRDKYILLLTEMDDSAYLQEAFKLDKQEGIESTYLFSMHVNLTKDICNSVSITEMSDNPMNYSELKYTGWRESIVNMILPSDQPIFLQYTDPKYLTEQLEARRTISIDCQMMNLEGKYIWVKLMFNKIMNANNDFCFVFMVQDIHESSMRLLADLQKYEEMSIHDPLTGIFNHGRIEDEFHTVMKRQKEEHFPVSIAMFDLDFFKGINDTYGHATGDYVLRELASVVSEAIAEYNASFGRWGGEEFIIIFSGIEKQELFEIAEQLRIKIAQHQFGNVSRITGSFGVIELNEDETAQEAFGRLDRALYAAKFCGRNCVVCD